MGLDMNLEESIYVGGQYEHNNVHGVIRFQRGPKEVDVPANTVSEIIVHRGYWRKANAIHKWFVDQVQNGTDDCGRYWVSKEQLVELKGICEKILNAESEQERVRLALELLPPQPGFFFGGTEIDQMYFEDLSDTVRIINDLPENGDYYYRSSW